LAAQIQAPTAIPALQHHAARTQRRVRQGYAQLKGADCLRQNSDIENLNPDIEVPQYRTG
jgi:hypothetical protein